MKLHRLRDPDQRGVGEQIEKIGKGFVRSLRPKKRISKTESGARAAVTAGARKAEEAPGTGQLIQGRVNARWEVEFWQRAVGYDSNFIGPKRMGISTFIGLLVD